MARHDLPSGGWVELREKKIFRAKDQKRMLKMVRDSESISMETMQKIAAGTKDGAAPQVDMTQAMDWGLSVFDGLMIMMVQDWYLPYPPEEADDGSEREWALPSVDKSMVGELTQSDYNRLVELVQPLMDAAFPTKPDPSDYDNPQSPTVPASA